jgi:energy-coupling factor transporter transmembrane protein EcfT
MQKKRLILPILFLLQIIGFNILSNFPEFVEQYYSNGLYPYISKFSRIVFGSLPFSVGDCIYAIVIFFVIKWFWKNRKTWKLEWKNNMMQVLSFVSVFYFFFHILWAFNYSREPLFEKMSIKKDYSDQDLLVFTKKMIDKTNTIHYQITKNDSLKTVFPYTQETAFKMNLNGYKNLSNEYAYFTYSHLSVKKSLFSLPLTYMGFGGYLNPFTNEAQVNDMMPQYLPNHFLS